MISARILNVDLSKKEIWLENIDWQGIGGRGFGANLLRKNLVKNAFDEKSSVFFISSPLVGFAPAVNRTWVVCVSPLTGFYLCSSAGGWFGGELRKSGIDVLRILGRLDSPGYLLVKNGRASIEDASKIWGRTTDKVVSFLDRKHGGKTACIGPAGENEVLYANILAEERAFGRGGHGAVLGNKKLKAIHVVGRMEIPCENLEKSREIYKKMLKEVLKQKDWQKEGTLSLCEVINSAHGWPTANFRRVYFEKGEKIYYKGFEKFIVERKGCFNCPVQCARWMKIGKKIRDGPEYETVWAFGPQIENDSPEKIIKANVLCDELGLDTISCGNILGFYLECVEKGLLKKEWTWLQIIKKIAYKKGIGELLSKGSKAVTAGAYFAINQAGMELPAYDPRAFPGMALTYIFSPRHGCHLKAWVVGHELKMPLEKRLSLKGKAEIVYKMMFRQLSFVDSVCLCSFLDLPDDLIVEQYNAVVGSDYTVEDFERIGKECLNIERNIDVSLGLTKEKDTLPGRILKEPVVVQGKEIYLENELEDAKKEFYDLSGW
ncbi:MAG: aldehyde ferredoxin oxidoreductase C-terminal domain-containing protein [archaeon]